MLANRSFHLQCDQTVHFDGIFHRQFFDKWLDEARDNHCCGFLFAEATGHEIEELLLTYFAHRSFVTDGDIVFVDLDIRIRIGARFGIEQKRITNNIGFDALRTFIDFDHPADRKPVRRPC